MKKIIILIVFITGYSGFSQIKSGKNLDISVLYRMDYKKFVTSESAISENTVLIINDQGSLFTFETMMNLNKINQDRKPTLEEVFLYKSTYYYVIKNNGNSILHLEAIGNDMYRFEEELNHNWKLINQDTLISGYRCKKAVVNYSGREWTAWYTPEIPLAHGPYKFHGLPGLILNIYDSDGVFDFVVNEIRTGNFEVDSKLTNYFVNEDEKTFENIKSELFYVTRTKFWQMSLNEKIQYMNRDNSANHSIKAEVISGEKPRLDSKPKTRNFIERYE